MNLHIYSAAMQPATDFTDSNMEPPYRKRYTPGQMLRCECCNRKHPARDVVVQCYYDGWRFWCAPERGCKHPRLIEAKRRREFRNRSRGQKKRWAVARHNTVVYAHRLLLGGERRSHEFKAGFEAQLTWLAKGSPKNACEEARIIAMDAPA